MLGGRQAPSLSRGAALLRWDVSRTPRPGSCTPRTLTYLLKWGAMDLRAGLTFDWLILFLMALAALVWGPLLYAAAG